LPKRKEESRRTYFLSILERKGREKVYLYGEKKRGGDERKASPLKGRERGDPENRSSQKRENNPRRRLKEKEGKKSF